MGVPLLAQPKFSTIVNEKEIGKNEYLQVEYVVENAKSVEQFTAPAFKGFIIASGPATQTGWSSNNGVISKYEGLSFVLKPTQPGKYVIAGASAIIDGKKMSSNSVSIKVTNTITPNSNNPALSPFAPDIPEEKPEVNEDYILKKGENAKDKIKNNLLAKLEVNKTSCYIGEPIIATYKLCTRLKSESRVSKRPTLSQFSVYDLVPPESNSNPTVENINGKPYNVHIIRKVQLYALQDGNLELEPVELDNTVRFVRMETSNNKNSVQQLLDEYLSGLSNGKIEDLNVTIASKPVTITVKPLPAANKPADFDGAVGRFTITAALANPNIVANETNYLNITISGAGNIPLINGPSISWPTLINAEEPSVKETVDKLVTPIKGEKIFRYPFSVKQKGICVIPPVSFSYFDPAVNAYKTITTDSIEVEVKQASDKQRETKAVLPKPKPDANFFSLKYLLWFFPVFVLVFLWMWLRNKKSKPVIKLPVMSNEEPVQEKNLVISDPLESAKNALDLGNSQLFYTETGKACWNMLGQKLNLPSSQLNKFAVTALLRKRAVPAALIIQLESVLQECEMALYTPVHSENDMRQTLDKTASLLQSLETLL